MTKEYYDFESLLYEYFNDDLELLESFAKNGKIIRTAYDGTYKVISF